MILNLKYIFNFYLYYQLFGDKSDFIKLKKNK